VFRNVTGRKGEDGLHLCLCREMPESVFSRRFYADLLRNREVGVKHISYLQAYYRSDDYVIYSYWIRRVRNPLIEDNFYAQQLF
jgi:hypothetical protein